VTSDFSTLGHVAAGMFGTLGRWRFQTEAGAHKAFRRG